MKTNQADQENLNIAPTQQIEAKQQLLVTNEVTPIIQPNNNKATLDDELYLCTTGLSQPDDTFDEYRTFGGKYTEEYFEEYEQSEQCLYSPTEEEYAEYLASLENDQERG